MGLAIVNSRACIGVEAPPVSVEVHISNGMHRHITGNEKCRREGDKLEGRREGGEEMSMRKRV